MDFTKILWKLFKINRDDINKFNFDAEILLWEIYEKGKADGIKQERKTVQTILKQK